MKRREKEQYITTYLASNGGKMERVKLVNELVRVGVVKDNDEFESMVTKLEKHEYVACEGSQVIYKKTKTRIPSFEDMFINDRTKVKDDVVLSPNGMPSTPLSIK